MIESETTGLSKAEVIVINDEGIGEAEIEMIPAEQDLVFVVNSTVEARFCCAPHRVKALVAGWLVGEGIIETGADVLALETDLISARVDITLSDACFKKLQSRVDTTTTPVIGETSFGAKTDTILELDHEGVESLARNFRQLFLSLKSAERMCYLSSIATSADILTYGEGFHRINSFYRAMGEMVRNNQDQEGKIALMNFGLSRVLVSKLARAGIAMAICFAPPTSSAIDLANDYYVSIICASNGQGTRVYSAPWRVI